MKDWLGNVVLSIAGGIVILGLLVLNAYWQRLVRTEEEKDRIAAQSRRPDDI